MKEKKLYKIAFMGDKDHGCDIISTLESWGGSNYYSRIGSDPEYVYFINDLGTIDLIHNSEMLSEEMKNFYFMFWHDYNIECHLKVGESINYGGQDYYVDDILFDANNKRIVYKLKSFGIGVEYITNNELTPTEEWQTKEENNEYLCKNNMKKNLAIKGHPTRGKEVIELLEMMGGKNTAYHGTDINVIYTIDDKGIIRSLFFNDSVLMKMEYNIFTLEEFLEKYPFKVGDKVFDTADGDPGTIAAMKWDEDVSDMKYHVAFDNGNMGWYTNDTLGFLKKDKNLKDGKTMNKKLAIKGHPTRGNEVIKLLEMLGGINAEGYIGTNTWKDEYYFLDNGCIHAYDWCDGIKFTLEEFLYKYPFKVGDKVFLYDNITEGCVTGMEWDEDKGTVKYCVYTSAEYWCDVKELLKWNAEFLVNKEKSEEVDKMLHDITLSHLHRNHLEVVLSELYEHIKTTPKEELEREFEEIKEWSNVGPTVEEFMTFCESVNKKPKYPTTYDDCCEMLNADEFVEYELMVNFPKLINARNAYWKIAGEQMGLEKPWEPDWTNLDQLKYCIWVDVGEFITMINVRGQHILAFPTEEMRDAFFKNFKKEIEQCKEFL